MYRLMKTARVLLLAAASVYPVSALAANADKQGSAGKAATDVRLLDETAGPLAPQFAAVPIRYLTETPDNDKNGLYAVCHCAPKHPKSSLADVGPVS